MEQHTAILEMVVRAIASGAGGQPLAAWALEEIERQQKAEYARMQDWNDLIGQAPPCSP